MRIPSTHGSHLSSLALQASRFRCDGRESNLLAIEIRAAYRFWNEQRDKRRSLKNQTIRILSNQGFEQYPASEFRPFLQPQISQRKIQKYEH
jgi:hypothetical protein